MTFLRRCGAFIAEFSRFQNARQARSPLSREFSWLSRRPVSNPNLSSTDRWGPQSARTVATSTESSVLTQIIASSVMHRSICRLDSSFRQLQPSLVRPLLFCTAASGAAFVGAAAYAHNHERGLWQERTHDSRASSNTLLGRAKEAWQNLSVERKVMYSIIGINVGVFGLWRLPILQVRLPGCPSSPGRSACAMQAADLDCDFIACLLSWEVSCASLAGCNSGAGRAPSAVLPCAGCHVEVVSHAAATPEDAASLHSTDMHLQPRGSGSPGLQHDCLQLLWGQHEPGTPVFKAHPASSCLFQLALHLILADSIIAEQWRLPICCRLYPLGQQAAEYGLQLSSCLASHRGNMLTCIWREGWSGAPQVFGGEQFLFFFLTAGMVSSLTSYAGRLRSLKGGHSLGASGAVYACFAGMAILFPGMHALLPHACTLIVVSSCSCSTQLCSPAHPRIDLLQQLLPRESMLSGVCVTAWGG